MAPPDDTPRNHDESSSESVSPVEEKKEPEEEEPAPVLKTSSSATTLFERLGGTAAVRAVVDDFYRRCLDDPNLSFFFDASKLSALKAHQLRFLQMAFADSIPDGVDVSSMLLDKHRTLFEERGLNATHFDGVCLHLVASLDSAGAHPDLIQEAAGIVLPLRAVFEKGEQWYGRGDAVVADANNVVGEEEAHDGETTPENAAGATSSRQQEPHFGSHAVLHSSAAAAHGTKPATLSDRLGGNEALRAAVSGLYERLLDDEDLATFFQNVNMTALKLHQLEFLKVAFGQVPKDLDVAGLLISKHAQLFEAGLNASHFDRVATHLADTLRELGVSEALVEEAVGVVGTLRPAFEEGASRAQGRATGP